MKPEYIIVINDGSTDRTQEILNDIQKNSNGSLHVIQHPDRGYDVNRTVKNWNEAIKLTKDKNLQREKPMCPYVRSLNDELPMAI